MVAARTKGEGHRDTGCGAAPMQFVAEKPSALGFTATHKRFPAYLATAALAYPLAHGQRKGINQVERVLLEGLSNVAQQPLQPAQQLVQAAVEARDTHLRNVAPLHHHIQGTFMMIMEVASSDHRYC